MELTEKKKAELDALSYEELLRLWRFAPSGDELFQGATGQYICIRMTQLRSEPGGDEMHTAASKRIGWDKP